MIISTYVPTLTSCDVNKGAFYENLNPLFKSTPATDSIIVVENFNAREGSDWKLKGYTKTTQAWEDAQMACP